MLFSVDFLGNYYAMGRLSLLWNKFEIKKSEVP